MKYSTLVAMRGYAVIRQKMESETTPSGIVKPGAHRKIIEHVGKVVSIGPGRETETYVEGDRVHHSLSQGDTVMYNPSNAMIWKDESEVPYVVVPLTEIVAVVKTSDA
jgi:co-chaperonin GroES (HSP10)